MTGFQRVVRSDLRSPSEVEAEKRITADLLNNKQRCADQLQAITAAQIRCMRAIQAQNYEPTADQARTMDDLALQYAEARKGVFEASAVCDVPVFVKPIQD